MTNLEKIKLEDEMNRIMMIDITHSDKDFKAKIKDVGQILVQLELLNAKDAENPTVFVDTWSDYTKRKIDKIIAKTKR